MAATESAGVKVPGSALPWLPGTTRVAPFSSVKSVSAQMVESSTWTSSGNGKKSKHH